eukprot:tig00001234_g7752.t1
MGVCATAEPSQVLSCSDDKTVVLFDWCSGEGAGAVAGAREAVNKARAGGGRGGGRGDGAGAYGKATGAIFSASRDTTLKRWGPPALPPRPPPRLRETPQTTPASSRVADNAVRLWDVERGTSISCQKISNNLVTSVRWLEEACVLQVGEDLELRVWDTRSMRVAQQWRGHTYIPLACDASEDFNTSANACALLPPADHRGRLLLATGSTDRTIRVWDTADGACVASVRVPHSSTILCLAPPSPQLRCIGRTAPSSSADDDVDFDS